VDDGIIGCGGGGSNGGGGGGGWGDDGVEKKKEEKREWWAELVRRVWEGNRFRSLKHTHTHTHTHTPNKQDTTNKQTNKKHRLTGIIIIVIEFNSIHNTLLSKSNTLSNGKFLLHYNEKKSSSSSPEADIHTTACVMFIPPSPPPMYIHPPFIPIKRPINTHSFTQSDKHTRGLDTHYFACT
jgi:hypothetical protein